YKNGLHDAYRALFGRGAQTVDLALVCFLVEKRNAQAERPLFSCTHSEFRFWWRAASALTKEEALENCRVTDHQDGRFGTGRNLSAAQSQSDTGSENQRFAWLANRLCCQRPVLGSRRLASPCDYFRGARTVR